MQTQIVSEQQHLQFPKSNFRQGKSKMEPQNAISEERMFAKSACPFQRRYKLRKLGAVTNSLDNTNDSRRSSHESVLFYHQLWMKITVLK